MELPMVEDRPDLCYRMTIFGMRPARRMDDGSIRKGYFATQKEAIERHERNMSELEESRKRSQKEADLLLDIKEKQFSEFVNLFKSDGSGIRSDAYVFNESAYDSFIRISVKVNGHIYARKINV